MPKFVTQKPEVFAGKSSNGNAETGGIQVTLDYNRPNDPKVLLYIKF
jgi:hypothetical protein